MPLDVAALRARFPSLESGLAFFDGPGGTQTPREVGDAIAATLTGPLSNRGTGNPSARNAEDAVAAYRLAVADLLHADPRGVVHGRSATQLTYDVSRTLARTWEPGDEIVLSALDHDANVAPWLQAAERAGVTVRWWELDVATAELDVDALASVVGERTRLVAVTAASNLLGTVPDVAAAAKLAHAAGALIYVDGVHHAAHAAVDVGALGADFYVCSAYKLMGPHCASLVASPDLLATLSPDKLRPAPDAVPERYELGTLPYEVLAGVTAAVEVIASCSGEDASTPRRDRIVRAGALVEEHELRLRGVIEERLATWDRVIVHSRARHRTPTLYLSFDGLDAGDVSQRLAAAGVVAPAGSFYAFEPFGRLGLETPGLRIGLAPYTDDADVDRLLDVLASAVAG